MRSILLAGFLALVASLSAWAAPIDTLAPQLETQQLPPRLAEAVQAVRQGNNEQAATLTRAFLKEQPNSVIAHEILAAAAWNLRRADEAESALAAALRIDPRRIPSLLMRGQLWIDRGDPKRAEGYFRQIIAIQPSLEVARTNLAEALMRQGRIDAAIFELQESLRLTQGADVNSRYLLANLYYELGRPAEAEALLSGLIDGGTPAVPVLLLQGLVKLDLWKYEEAERLLKRVIEQEPRSEWGRLGLASLQASQEQLSPARAALETLVKEKPAWSLAHFQLGRVLLQKRLTAAALQAFEQAERTSPDAAVTRVRVAQLLLQAGEVDQALAKAKAEVAAPTAGAQARALVVEAYARRGKREQAEPVLQAAVSALPPSDPAGLIDLGRFYLSLGRAQDALLTFERAARVKPEAREPQVGLANAFVALKRRPEAIAAAQRAAKSQGESVESVLLLASVHERLGDAEEAARIYQRWLVKDRNSLIVNRALAALYVRQKRLPDAIRVLEETAKGNPKAPAPVADLAAVHLASGRTADAIVLYRRALERDPSDPTLMNNLAYLLSRDPKNLDEAARLADRAYRSSAADPSIADTTGWVAYLRGDLARAERILLAAVRSDPGNPEIQHHLGLVYAKQNKKADALRALEQASRTPGYHGASDAKRALETLN